MWVLGALEEEGPGNSGPGGQPGEAGLSGEARKEPGGKAGPGYSEKGTGTGPAVTIHSDLCEWGPGRGLWA